METIGSAGHSSDVDQVLWEDGDTELTVDAMLGLVQRLERTVTDEQRLFRECELDCAYRLAESDVEFVTRACGPGAAADLRSAVLAHVSAAHDLVGLDRTADAAAELRIAIRLRQQADTAKFGAE